MIDTDFELKTITPQSNNMILKGCYDRLSENMQLNPQPNSMETQENQTKKIMEKYFKLGQKVWDMRFGSGIVVGISDPFGFRISVDFEDGKSERYTEDGRFYNNDKNPSLFQTAPIITPNVPIIEFEKGELVWVKGPYNIETWQARYFSHEKEGQYYCFILQQKEGETSKWEQIRKFNDNPLLDKLMNY